MEKPTWNLNELNTTHDSINFEYKISKPTIISILDTEVYVMNKLSTHTKTKPRASFIQIQNIRARYKTVLHAIKHCESVKHEKTLTFQRA